MSRYTIPGYDPALQVVCGWDPPLQPYFGDVCDPRLPEDQDACLFMVGTSPYAIETLGDLYTALYPYALIPRATTSLGISMTRRGGRSSPTRPLTAHRRLSGFWGATRAIKRTFVVPLNEGNSMAPRGRPRRYPDEQTKWRELKRRQRHPTQRHVLASQTPGRYITDLDDLLTTGQRFGCLYADPPWQYDDQPPSSGAAKHYATLSVEALCALPVQALAAPEAHCHLWVTNAFLFEAQHLLAAWGFVYKSTFIWVKPHLGTGHYWRNSHEMLLLGVRGGLTAHNQKLRSWLEAPRDRHSAKPERVRDLVEQLSPGPYLELFGRAAVPGWTVWGNECLPTTGRLFKDRTG